MTDWCHPTPGYWGSHTWSEEGQAIRCRACGLYVAEPTDDEKHQAAVQRIAGKMFSDAVKRELANKKIVVERRSYLL